MFEWYDQAGCLHSITPSGLDAAFNNSTIIISPRWGCSEITVKLMKSKKNTNTTWATLTNEQKVNIEISLQQLSEGRGIPVKKVMMQLAKKYNLYPKG